MEECPYNVEENTLLADSGRIQFFSSTTQDVDHERNSFKICRKICNKLWNLYITANSKPLTAIILLFLIIGVNVALFFVAVLTHPVEIDYSLRAFEVPGHQESKKLDSLIAARDDMEKAAKEDKKKNQNRHRRADENPEVVIHSQYIREWRLDLVYVASDDNIFTENKLNYIRSIEKNLMKHQKFQNFCWKSKEALKDRILSKRYKGCMPPNSLIDYFYRTDYFDGQGKSLSDIQETLDYLLTKVSTFWYVDGNFGSDFPKSKYLRSQLHFGVPLPGYSDTEKSLKEQHRIFRNFLVDYVKQLGSSSSEQVTVLYGSSDIYDYEIKHTFYHDVLFAAISFGLIVFLLFILTSFSMWLTLFGVLTIAFSVPFSYFVYRVLLRIDTIGILTGTTVFVIIGIGVDDVFVFINVFRSATHLKDTRERMKHLMVTAGKATFFTSFTTAAAFGANALTKVPAVHDFGLFTCILVMSCWLMVVLLMPPCLFLWQKWFVKCEMCLCFNSCCHKVVGDGQLDMLIDDNLVEMSFRDQQVIESNQTHDTEPDRNMMSIDHHVHEQDKSTDCCTVTNMLTKLMDNFIAKPVLKYRRAVLLVYLVITGLSIVAVSHLKTASGRPELFPANTNLQKLLNLQFNFSSSYVDCSSCSDTLKPVHGSSRPRRFSAFHLPVRRSLDGMEFWANITREKNSTNFVWPKLEKSYGTAVPLIVNRTTIKVNRITGEMLNASVDSLNNTASPTRTGVTTAYPANFFNYTRNYSRNLKAKSEAGSLSSTVTSPASGVHSTALSTSKSVPLQNTSKPFSTKSTSFNTVASTMDDRTNATTVHMTVAMTKATTGKQDKSTEKGTTHVSTTQGTYSSTIPPLCPKPCTPVKRPIVDKTAIVFLVFGIKGVQLNNADRKHFFGREKGTPIYDDKFTMVGSQLQVVATGTLVKTFCRICLAFQNNTELVQPGGADCFPREVYRQLKLFQYDECQALVEPHYANGRQSLSMIGVIHNKIKWMAMSFESTTYKGGSAFDIMQDYKKWENFTRSVLDGPGIPDMLKSGFQTSDTWVNMFSEIIAVNGAIYGITLSLVLCFAAVVIFTANWRLSFIIFMTIAGALCLVVAVFWLAGWTLGAIEAISLSILVGTSVDYTVHLTEGYIMANRIADFEGISRMEMRREHTRMALNHIGVSIFSSALTTLIAAIPLCLTQIQLFAKFGQILAINTGMSILYTLTICVSLLSIMGPTRFKGSVKSHFLALIYVAIFLGLITLVLYLLNTFAGMNIPGPSGGQLFQ